MDGTESGRNLFISIRRVDPNDDIMRNNGESKYRLDSSRIIDFFRVHLYFSSKIGD